MQIAKKSKQNTDSSWLLVEPLEQRQLLAFVHPGLVNTEADFTRMRTKVAEGAQPWTAAYATLTSDWTGHSPNWVPHPVATVTRDSNGGNFGLLANDIAVAYGSALRWKISGDTAYADNAVRILNAWGSTLTGVGGDPNMDLLELNAYQFANVAEIMRTYSGWAAADFTTFKTMMKTVFYPMASDFLSRHDGQAYSYMWANWDLQNMDAIYAIGVLNDDSSLTTEATNYFYNGIGEGNINRTVYFMHPGYLGQTQESGRDQGHNTLEIALLAPFCQMAWNQGVDLFSYENNRVLAGAEYIAKYNLGNDVPFTIYAQETGYPSASINTAISSNARGSQRAGWDIIYNHYVNIEGLAARYSAQFAGQMRSAGYTGQDQPSFDALTASLDPIATGANPSGLTAVVTAQQPVLSWWGSAYATGYNVQRATTSGGPYTTIATGLTTNTYTDTAAVAGNTYYYVVTASLAGGSQTGASNEAQAIIGTSLQGQLLFDESSGATASDATSSGRTGTLVNGATWTTGKSGNAVTLASASSQYVSLPSGVVSDLSDFTIATWVNLASAATWARIFDFGTSSERYMMLTPKNGAGKVAFAITGSGPGGEQTIVGTAPLPTGQWVHVAVAVNGSIGTLYVNGTAVGQNINMAFSPFRLGATPNNWIGRSQFSSDPYLNGKLDDFRIYRGALSSSAVYTLATSNQPPAVPSAPTGLTAAAVAGNLINLNWAAAATATNYTVKRSTVAGGPYTAIAAVFNTTSYTDTNRTAGVTYYYVVSAANPGGDGANSGQASATALPPLPAAPTNLSASSASSASVLVNWTAGANDATYTLKRSTTSSGPYTTIASGLTAPTYTDAGLSTGTTYYYVVAGLNASGTSANSAEASATPTDLLVHLKFDETTGTTAADASGNGKAATLLNGPLFAAGSLNNALDLDGTDDYATLPTGVVSGVTNITIATRVFLDVASTWTRLFDFGTGTTNYMFLTPKNGATNVARFAIRTSATSEQTINSTSALPVGTWVHVAVTLNGSVGILYVNGVEVGRNSAMTVNPSSLGATTQNYLGKSQFADPYLNGRLDDFRIYTRALSGTEIAALATATIPAAPAGLTATSADSQATLNWSPSTGATTYTIKRAAISGGPYDVVASGVTTTSYVDTGLTNDAAYFYVVSATNGVAGEGPNSAETAVTPEPIAPTIASPASASPSPALGNTATLSVLGADDGGEANLTYTWATTGTPPAVVGFGVNGTNSAKSVLATFTQTGAYSFAVTITDAAGLSATGSVNVIVSQTLTSISVIPATTSVNTNATQQFTATGYDQFGNALLAQPALTWTVASGGGTVSSSGLYTAAGSSGTATVSAASGLVSGSAAVAVVLASPSVPTNLTATAVSAAQINLTWSDTANNETGFTLERATNATFTSNLVSVALGANVTGYSATGLAAGTTYYFRVRALNAAGPSVNSAVASATTLALTVSTTYQAELATRSGGTVVAKQYAGYTGTGYIDLPINNGAIDWSVQNASAGTAKLTFRYALGAASARSLQLKINGVVVSTVSFPTTGSWSTWKTLDLNVTLKAGTNSVRFTSIGQDGPNLDALTVTQTPTAAPAATVYQSEAAVLAGGTTVGTANAGYTGTGYADFNTTGGSVVWTVNAASAGAYRLGFHYALGTTTSRNVALTLNGTAVISGVTFTNTGSWTTWTDVALSVNLLAGTNTIRLASTGQDGGNLDYLSVAKV